MGGNALKNIKTVRINPDDYQRIKILVAEQLRKIGYIISEIKEAPGKESYGDLDLLWWRNPNDKYDIRKDVIQLFKPQEMVSNGEVLS